MSEHPTLALAISAARRGPAPPPHACIASMGSDSPTKQLKCEMMTPLDMIPGTPEFLHNCG
eukprot:1182510-Prorocentrum_minimum.AAC.9